MTNFDFLLSVPEFASFGEIAAAAEKIYSIDPAACVLNCRRAMEFAVKWMYSVDSAPSIRELCPSLSVSSVEGALRKLVASGELKREDSGKSTCYYRTK